MTLQLSPNTQAVLLLTAPLITGVEESSSDLFTPAEYRKLELSLAKISLQLVNLISNDRIEIFGDAP